MNHLEPGSLRRACDLATALTPAQRAHLQSCALCRRHLEGIAANAETARTAFAAMPGPPASLDVARSQVRARLATSPPRRRAIVVALVPRALLATAACVGMAFAFADVPSVATGVLGRFAPTAVAPLALDARDIAALRSMPGLAAFGTLRSRVIAADYEVPGLREAAAAVPFVPKSPAYVPAAAPRTVRTMVSGRSVTDFTLDVGRAELAADVAGTPLPPMPPGVDGTVLEAGVGPAIVTTYAEAGETPATIGDVMNLAISPGSPPALAIVQLALPRIVSNGAPVATIERYLLEQPGVSPHLAAQFAAFDPATTLPIPVPMERAFARPALLHGHEGMTFGDESSGFAGAVWQEDGMLYGVYGRLPLHEITSVAQTLR